MTPEVFTPFQTQAHAENMDFLYGHPENIDRATVDQLSFMDAMWAVAVIKMQPEIERWQAHFNATLGAGLRSISRRMDEEMLATLQDSN